MKIIGNWMSFSPLKVSENDQFAVSDSINGGTTISALDVKIYLGNTDKTSLLMTTGTQSYTGNSYVTKILSALKGGNIYVLAARVTVDGDVITRKCEIRVQKESELS
jgi:hypothetical protein